MIRVLVIEDNVGFRDALVALLEQQTDLEVVGKAGSLSEVRTIIEALLDSMDVVLLDRGLPDGDGLKLLGEVRAVSPSVRVYVISSTAEVIHPRDAIEAGADGVIDKMETPEQVFAAIRQGGE
jgi:DNA-binding NarL/FixJ family response regulator